MQSVAANFVWKTTEFPAARKGFRWSISLSTVVVSFTGLVVWCERRQYRKKQAALESVSDKSPAESIEIKD